MKKFLNFCVHANGGWCHEWIVTPKECFYMHRASTQHPVLEIWTCLYICCVASRHLSLRGVGLNSGFARICCEEGQSWKLYHGALTVNFRAGCSSCSMTNSFVTNAVLMERAVSCWHLHQLISQTTQYLDSWLTDLLQSEIKMKPLDIEGGTCPSDP